MIDYFKAYVNYRNDTRFKELREAGVFAVAKNYTDPETGEILKEAFLYKKIVIRLLGDGFELRGSLHKYRSIINGIATSEQIDKHRGYNGDLFTLKDVTSTINHLCGVLDISPNICTLQNIEIGINNVVTFAPFDFLKGVISHRNDYTPEIKHRGNYIQFKHNEYYIKLYNKGRQYKLPNEVVRVEIKVMKMRKLTEAGINIYTLADINETTLKQAFDLLYKEFNEVIYYDYSINTGGLTDEKRHKVLEYKNTTYWKGLDKHGKKHHKKQLNNLIEKHSDNYKGQIQTQMIAGYNATINGKEGDYTLPAPQPIGQKYATFSPTIQDAKSAPKNEKYATFSPPPENTKYATFSPPPENTKYATFSPFKYSVRKWQEGTKKLPSKIIDNLPNIEGVNFELKNAPEIDKKKLSSDYPRKCVVTGISLELEKGNIPYIRTKTILHVKETDPQLYSLLCSLLLPHTGKVPIFENSIIKQLAKQVRNRYFNKSEATRLVMRGGDLKQQLTLDL